MIRFFRRGIVHGHSNRRSDPTSGAATPPSLLRGEFLLPSSYPGRHMPLPRLEPGTFGNRWVSVANWATLVG
ncbi:hypothetical protein HanRHA438_Chr15g0719061 [Helianthus annuus]|nr:hypothetical protein HanRHA438_Chr15g0719061 [Helianthus annuus]